MHLAVSTCLLLGACAIAVAPDERPIDGSTSMPDAVTLDARSLDAPGAETITLSQSTSMTVQPATSLGCAQAGSSRENSYYRVFRLADHGIAVPFTPREVSFGVQEVEGGTTNIQVRLHLLVGAMSLANLSTIATASVDLGTSSTMASVAVTAPAVPPSATLVAEVLVPDLAGTGRSFLIGANSAGETRSGYIRSPACGTPQPSTFASKSFPNVHIILVVSGTR